MVIRQLLEIDIQHTVLMRIVQVFEQRQKEVYELHFEKLQKLFALAANLAPAIQKNEREAHYFGTGAEVDYSGFVPRVRIPEKAPDFSFLERLLKEPKKDPEKE